MKHIALALGLFGAALLGACAHGAGGDALVIEGCPIYADPDAAPIEGAAVLIEGGQIAAIGPRAALAAPAGARVIDCAGGAVAPGFWNAHVHFLGPAWAGADADVQALLDDLALSHGFTTVVDLASDLQTTLALRARIESGALRGPRILTAGTAFVGPDGTPFYMPEGMVLPEFSDAEAARAAAEAELAAGADLLKMMTVSLNRPQPPFAELAPDVIAAITGVARAHGVRAVAHPTNEHGVRLALNGGVTMLAHTTPATGPWPDDLVAALAREGVALTPTITLWRYELEKGQLPEAMIAAWTAHAEGQTRALAAAGGTVLFGTDGGYMSMTDPAPEYAALARAGLDAEAILRTLTTAPRRFFDGEEGPMLTPGAVADIVVLSGDPRVAGIGALANPQLVMRAGAIVHEARR